MKRTRDKKNLSGFDQFFPQCVIESFYNQSNICLYHFIHYIFHKVDK